MDIILDFFEDVTGYDIKSFFSRSFDFLQEQYPKIYQYYTGSANAEKKAFTELSYLINEASKIDSIFYSSASSLSVNIEYWDLLDTFDSLRGKLALINKLYKWVRSSYTNNYSGDVKIDYILSQSETVEDAANVLGYSQNEIGWVDLAIDSDLSENDYQSDGGTLLKASFKNNQTLNIQSVVDLMQGENILGKDIDKKITLSDDDIATLPPIKTINQSIDIKLNTRRESIPEYRNLGISVFEGQSRKFFNYPIIIREILSMFALDDTFDTVEVKDIKTDKDAIAIDMIITSKLKDVQISKILQF